VTTYNDAPPAAPHKVERIGECSLCRLVIFRTGDGRELARQGKKRVPHHHKKKYRVRPDLPEQDNDRGWMDYARGMGAW